MKVKHKIPKWVTQGKSIKQLIKELKTFEDQNSEVRISLDYGDKHSPISMVGKIGKNCVLMCAECYHLGEWQEFMDKADAKEKSAAPKKKSKTPNQSMEHRGEPAAGSPRCSCHR